MLIKKSTKLPIKPLGNDGSSSQTPLEQIQVNGGEINMLGDACAAQYSMNSRVPE